MFLGPKKQINNHIVSQKLVIFVSIEGEITKNATFEVRLNIV